MTRKIAITSLLLCSLWGQVSAQESYPDRARKYVQQYAQYAIADQRSTGVPASITLGQGILETEAGISELVTEANNHFGIKCKNGWQGATFLHDDDAKGECFKKYNSALESYHDHSAHLLKNQRYGILFSYSPTDYARWAHGLKKCGYATNPKYAYQLIKIIEDYHLQEFTYAALDSNYKINMPSADTTSQTMIVSTQAKKQDTVAAGAITAVNTSSVVTSTVAATPMPAPTADSTITLSSGGSIDTVVNTDTANGALGAILMVNGLKAIRVHKGDALLPYAVKLKVRYGHLLEINDMPEDPVTSDMYIYLEKKHAAGLKSSHSVREGETLHMVAQEEGVQLKKLAAFNLLRPAEVPVTGTVLNLQGPALTKPAVKEVMMAYSGDVQDQQPADQQPQTAATTSSEQEIGFGMGFQNPAQAQAMPVKEEPAAMPAPAKPHEETVVAEPQPKQSQSKTANTKHVVKKGETAFSIAKRYNVTVDDIAEWNSVKPQNLKVGQTLVIKH